MRLRGQFIRHRLVYGIADDGLHLLPQPGHEGAGLLLHHAGDRLAQALVQHDIDALHDPVHHQFLESRRQRCGCWIARRASSPALRVRTWTD